MTVITQWYQTSVLDGYTAASDFGEQLESLTTVTGWAELNGKTVMTERTVTASNRSHVIRRTSETWSYEGIGTAPSLHEKVTQARLYLPGINRRTSLIEVDRQRTGFWIDAIVQSESQELSYRTERWGYVLYDIHPTQITLTADQKAFLVAQGRDPVQNTIDYVLDSARTWDEATNHPGAVVEKEDVRQRVIWQLIEVIEHRSTETSKLIETSTVTKNYVKPGQSTMDGPHYRTKDGIRFDLPVDPSPPVIEAEGQSASGELLRVSGGGAEFDVAWPSPHKLTVPCGSYKVYRLTVTQPARGAIGDPLDIWNPDPITPPHTYRIMPAETATEDYTGTPVATSLPAQTPEAEPEDPTPPDGEYWQLVGTIEDLTKEMQTGTLLDDGVEDGAVYRYRATAVIGDSESAPSREITVSYGGGKTYTSTIAVKVITTPDGIEVDATLPDDADAPVTDWGESIVFDYVPFNPDMLDLTEFGTDVAIKQALADSGAQRLTVHLTNSAFIRPGTMVKLPVTGWRTIGNALKIDSEVESITGRVVGYSASWSRDASTGAPRVSGTTLVVEPVIPG